MTRIEYENTLRDLLGLGADFVSSLPADARGDSGFALAGPVGEVDAERLQQTAEEVAASAVARDLPGLLGCTPEQSQEAACIEQFIRTFGRRAFRRALTPDEVSDLSTLFRGVRVTLGASLEDAAAALLAAMLQAPQFLYSWERTTPDDLAATIVALNPDELASRLSYLLWRSVPDAALLEAVDAGRLSTPEDVAREARRLLGSPRSTASMVDFVRGWLRLPDRMDDPLSRAANGETALFVESTLADGASLAALFTSPTNFVSSPLAPIYGASGDFSEEPSGLVVNPQQRFGLLTQVSFLGTNADGAQSHPVKRGAVVFKQLLCGELPPIPENVPPPGPQREGVPNRVRFEAHGQNACAVGCHHILDPLGFAFEHYDGTGRYREMDGGEPVDASGDLQLPSGSHFTFSGARELVEQIVESPELKNCAVRQALRLSLSRREQPADDQSLQAASAAFAAAGYDLRELFVAAVSTPSFTHRSSSLP